MDPTTPRLTDIREEQRSSAGVPSSHSASNGGDDELRKLISEAPPPIHGIPAGPRVAPAAAPRPRGGRRGSAVSIDYFNPEGVRDLQRTLTNMSTLELDNARPRTDPGRKASSSVDSEATLTPGDGPFDFEKSLRQFLKRFVDARLLPLIF